MTKTHVKHRTNSILCYWLAIIIIMGGLSLYIANAVPEGATIAWMANDSGPTLTPGSRADPGGKIITVNLNLSQQDTAWKAYVGNVTGTYVLQNSNNMSIYEWPMGSTVTGEVYISRNSSVNFTTGAISCADDGEMDTEQIALGMTSALTDSINSTFNTTNHSSFSAGYNSIAENQCSAVALWVNDTVQTPSPSAVFQEVTLHDGSNLVYAAIINNDEIGYVNTTYFDFQAIVAENRTSSTGTAYYFYLELGS